MYWAVGLLPLSFWMMHLVYPCDPLVPMKTPTRKSDLTHTLCAECPILLGKSVNKKTIDFRWSHSPKKTVNYLEFPFWDWWISYLHILCARDPEVSSCLNPPPGTWKTNRRRCSGPQRGRPNVGTFDPKDPVGRHMFYDVYGLITHLFSGVWCSLCLDKIWNSILNDNNHVCFEVFETPR